MSEESSFFSHSAPAKIAADNWGWRTTAGKYHCKIKERYSPIIETDTDCRVVVGCTTLVTVPSARAEFFNIICLLQRPTEARYRRKVMREKVLPIRVNFITLLRGRSWKRGFLPFFYFSPESVEKVENALNWKWRLKQFSVPEVSLFELASFRRWRRELLKRFH